MESDEEGFSWTGEDDVQTPEMFERQPPRFGRGQGEFGTGRRFDRDFEQPFTNERRTFEFEPPQRRAYSARRKPSPMQFDSFVEKPNQRGGLIRKEWWTFLFRISTAMGVATFFLATLAVVNAVIYSILYNQMVPSTLRIEIPVYFDFDPEDHGQFGAAFAATDSLHNLADRRAFLPTALIMFGNAKQQWKRVNTEEEREVFFETTKLSSGFWYDVKFSFTSPTVDDNTRQVGNFMISSELISLEGSKVIARSKRPVLVRNRAKNPQELAKASSGWFFSSKVETLMFEEDTVVHMTLFEKLRERFEPTEKVGGVRLFLSTPLVQLFDATVIFECQLFGLVYFIFHWRITAFLIYMIVLCGIQLVSASFLVGIFGVASAVSLFGNRDSGLRRRFSFDVDQEEGGSEFASQRSRPRKNRRSTSAGRDDDYSRGRSRSRRRMAASTPPMEFY